MLLVAVLEEAGIHPETPLRFKLVIGPRLREGDETCDGPDDSGSIRKHMSSPRRRGSVDPFRSLWLRRGAGRAAAVDECLMRRHDVDAAFDRLRDTVDETMNILCRH